jgi:hypothetical protein
VAGDHRQIGAEWGGSVPSGRIRAVSHAAPVPVQDRARRTHVSAAVVACAVVAVAAVAPLGQDRGWVAGVAVLQAVLVWAWVMGTATPGKWGGLVLAGASAGGADALLLRDQHDGLVPLLTVFGLLFPALLAHQLARGVVRTRLTESLSGVAAGCVAVVALACYLELRQDAGTVAAAGLLAAATGLLAGRLLDALRPEQVFAEGVFHGLLGVAGATVAGAAVSAARLRGGPVGLPGAALLGAGVGLTVGLVAVGAAYVALTVRPRRTPFAPITLPVLKVLLPLAVTAPVAYLLGLVVTG